FRFHRVADDVGAVESGGERTAGQGQWAGAQIRRRGEEEEVGRGVQDGSAAVAVTAGALVEGESAQTVDDQAAGAGERAVKPIAAARLVLKDDGLAAESARGAGENQAAAGDNRVGAAI